jgi:dTDP-4-amino-4,6-dideoxygalactose transaminase
MKQIPITKPFFDHEEFALITKPLETGWIVQGPYVQEFEKAIGAFVGSRYAVALNSCTSGQFIASRVIDLRPGDEVILPSYTWISTANSIEFLGAKPVFCDIDIRTYNIDVQQLEAKITGRTKAIYPVHLFGLAADMPAIMDIAGRYHLQVIEDCACGLGARIAGRHCGLFGLGGILSFHPRKSITTGEGGMIVTDDERFAALASSLRDHGAMKSDLARHREKGAYLLTEYEHLGYNMRLTDIQGALGVAQAKKIPWILNKKAELAKIYDSRLAAIPWLGMPETPPSFSHGYQAYCTLYKPDETREAIRKKDHEKIDQLNRERNLLMARLESDGIATRQGTHAVHIQKLYREKYNIQPMDYPASYAADRLTVALPFFPSITDEEIGYLFENLKRQERFISA